MPSILPIIPVSALQRSAKSALEGVKDYAVIRSHNRDVAFVLHPTFGRMLLQSGMLEQLRKSVGANTQGIEVTAKELETLIGRVLRELGKK